MPQTAKRLATITATGTIGTADLLYTCTTTAAIVSTLVICNTSSSDATYRVCISTATSYPTGPGNANGVNGYLIYGDTISANRSTFIPVGLTMDSVNKYLLVSTSSANNISFSAFGFEVS
jgi:hypothetical protein